MIVNSLRQIFTFCLGRGLVGGESFEVTNNFEDRVIIHGVVSSRGGASLKIIFFGGGGIGLYTPTENTYMVLGDNVIIN